MAGYLDGGYGTVAIQQSTARNIRVNADGTIAGATQRDFGITLVPGQPEDAAVPGVVNDVVTVSLINKQGTQEATLDGDVLQGEELYTAADGKVTSTSATGAYIRGIAMTDGLDGEIIAILPLVASAAVA